jgi:HD domain
MLQYADYASLLTHIPTVEEVLDHHGSELGDDLIAYRNHVYRVVNLCLAIVGDRPVELEKIAVAAAFHDIGIWTNNTFDYIAPSVAIAREHLAARGRADWIPEIEAMIVNHHKVTAPGPTSSSSKGRRALNGVEGQSLVEPFRRADWIDVTRGLRRFGLPRTFVAAVAATWPSAGFHRRLVELTIDRWWKHPLNPLPMVKW